MQKTPGAILPNPKLFTGRVDSDVAGLKGPAGLDSAAPDQQFRSVLDSRQAEGRGVAEATDAVTQGGSNLPPAGKAQPAAGNAPQDAASSEDVTAPTGGGVLVAETGAVSDSDSESRLGAFLTTGAPPNLPEDPALPTLTEIVQPAAAKVSGSASMAASGEAIGSAPAAASRIAATAGGHSAGQGLPVVTNVVGSASGSIDGVSEWTISPDGAISRSASDASRPSSPNSRDEGALSRLAQLRSGANETAAAAKSQSTTDVTARADSLSANGLPGALRQTTAAKELAADSRRSDPKLARAGEPSAVTRLVGVGPATADSADTEFVVQQAFGSASSEFARPVIGGRGRPGRDQILRQGLTLDRSAPQLSAERGEVSQSLLEAAGVRQLTTSSTPGPQVITAAAPSATPVNLSLAAPTAAVAGAAPQPQFDISVPVLDPAWQTAVNERVVMMAGRGVQSAELRLSPAELGPLQVQLAVDERGVSVTINATHAATREALEGAIPRLREMLAEQGMNLNGASVSDQGADARAQRDTGDSEAAGAVSALTDDEAATAESDIGAISRRARPDSMVDLFA